MLPFIRKMGVQNGYHATKLFLFNGKESITAPEFKDVEDFRLRYVENTLSII